MDITLIIFSFLGPLIIMSSGYFFNKISKSEPNYIFGYRTRRSCASPQAWNYANQLAGKFMYIVGIVSSSTMIFLLLFLRDATRDLLERYIAIHAYSTIVLIIAVITIVQIMLFKKYEKNGKEI